MSRAEQTDRDRVAKLIDITYMMAKEAIPSKKFPSLVEMEKRHGVDLGTTYINEKMCAQFMACIADTLENELSSALSKVKYFSLLTDGSTDTSVKEVELMYIIYVNQQGKLAQDFLSIRRVRDATAPGLKALLQDVLVHFRLNQEQQTQFMIGFGADGASVNMGVKKGLAQLLREDQIPWLVSVHCFNHRLELAVKDSFSRTYFDDIIEILTQLYYLYHNSPKRTGELEELASIMETQIRKPQKAHGTRWVQHKLRATQSLLKSYVVVVAHLESMASDPRHDQAKAKGILKKVTTFKFVVHLLYFEQLLLPLSKLSLAWQRDATEIPQLLATEKNLRQTLAQLKLPLDEQPFGGRQLLKTILEKAEGEHEPVEFHGVKLTHVVNSLHFFKTQRVPYVEKLETCLCQRFCFDQDTAASSMFNCASILDIRLWPSDQEDLKAYGNAIVQKAATHFMVPLALNGESGIIDNEWQEMKLFIDSNMRNLAPGEVWEKISASYSNQYPNISNLITILRIFPFSNALVERCFSTMNIVKTDWRASLEIKTLEQLMRIKKVGPTVAHFSPEQAVKHFFEQKARRPGVQPYGPRKASAAAGASTEEETTPPKSPRLELVELE